jgi:uncharacterized protein
MAAACVILFVTAAGAAAAQPAPPLLTAAVNDFANVIDQASEQELDRRIRALQRATGDTVVVATVATFQPYADLREYAVRMFENDDRGIGERGKDNGLLIVVAVEDRKVAVEVGYGLEGFVTDGFAGQTIREVILPPFRQGQYGAGLLAGATRLMSRIAEGRGVQLVDMPAEAPGAVPTGGAQDFGGAIRVVLFILFILFMMMMSRRSGGRRRRHWGVGPWSGWNSGVGSFGSGQGGFGGGFGGFGGRGGGGFGGFGGGRSGGGGASGGW